MKSTLLKPILALAILAGALHLAPAVRAQTLTNVFNFPTNAIVPDDDLTGFADTQEIVSPILSLTGIQVSLSLSGGYNGDLYVYLTHDTGFSVLLNRVGRTGSDEFGYADSGFDITFDDTASNGDIHNYGSVTNPLGGVLTGTWLPDGRNVHPNDVVDTDARTADLSSFQGLNPNGNWTLFLVDNAAVSEFVLNSWGMRLIGVVPEPGTYALLGLGAVGALLRLRRKP